MMKLTPISPHRVSPELEAVWQKHAAHIAWSTTSPKDPEFPTIASAEGQIRALSPPPRVRKIRRAKSLQPLAVPPPPPSPSTSNSNRRLEQIREDDDDDDSERIMSRSDDHSDSNIQRSRVLGKVGSDGEDQNRGRQDPLAHLREKARTRKVQTRRSVSASDLRKRMHPTEHSRGSGPCDPGVVVTAGARPFLISHNSTMTDARISIGSTASSNTTMSYRHADRTSFIDLLSPQESHFPLMSSSATASQHSSSRTTSYASNNLSIVSNNSNVRSRSRSPKPPVPTSPKPDFAYRSSPNLALRRTSPNADRPPTTNYLQPETRAELVKKSRKLAQLFGQTPGAGVMPNSHASFLDLPPSPRTRHMRGAMSVSEASQDQKPLPASHSAMERRHSTSIPPDDFYIEVGSERTSQVSHPYSRPNGAESPPTSFIDLSDEEDDSNGPFCAPGTPPSPSTRSLFESLSPDEQQEEVRRRKREKLAKLHRFLGSRVPANLVLGLDEAALSLPPLSPVPPPSEMESPSDDKKAWLRRRRSSSVAAFPAWSDDVDRVKDDLNEREKAINVRRGKKMEKVFGVAPPQTLYHTRYGPSPSVLELPRSDSSHSSAKFLSGIRTPTETGSSQPPSPRNSSKLRSKKNSRPSTADSSRHLLSQGSVAEDSPPPPARTRSGSLVYSHYQHSLKSLVDIIDRDDRESLAELHEYLNTPTPSTPTERRLSTRSERRRSLPARTSMTSLASEYSLAESIITPKAEVTDFQLRRRRAAKLTAFFGVDYRDLIQDVLDSIENGLEHERKHGTINPEEAEDLLHRLRQIKTKRDGLF